MIEELNKKTLKRLYVKEGKSLATIAKMFACSPKTIQNRCRKYEIKLRGHKKIKGLTKVLLKKLYIKEGKTTREIAQIIGCSREVIRCSCKQYGIPLRNPGSKKIEINKSTLRRLYIKEGKNFAKIAEIFDCAVGTISKKFKQFG